MARLRDHLGVGLDVPDLYQALWALLRQVPHGRVTTYGDLADALGNIAAARWVGEFLLEHDHSDDCPCHRVVRRTGELGLYITGDAGEKERRLKREGVGVADGRVDLSRFGWDAFQTDRPLARLTALQESIPGRVSLEPLERTPAEVAGVDVSYLSPGEAIGAYVLMDAADGRVVWSTTVRTPVRFPYIAGYLAFRELPLHLELLEEAAAHGRRAEVILVDGHGILHHRRAGIATHLGVAADVATIGVGKKLLCGRVDLKQMPAGEPRPISLDGQIVGAALKAKDSSRPIFVSPGHRISVDDAARIAQQAFRGHRLPEPIYLADRLSRTTAAAAKK